MISILIPVYNRNVVPLVTALQRQGIESGVPFDILVADDASDDSAACAGNALLDRLPHVRYHVFRENRGVQRIRKDMAVMALYPDLLLIDSDAMVTSDRFFACYAAVADGRTVVFGGFAYEGARHPSPGVSGQAFTAAERRGNLRWWYGVHREVFSAERLNRRPYAFLATFNLLIPRPVFLGVEGLEGLKGYGHEDTLLGMQLEHGGVPLLHIDNPLLHTGFRSNEAFLEETGAGVFNLYMLYRNFHPLPLLYKRSKLVRTFGWLKRAGLLRIYGNWFSRNERRLRRNLLSRRPSLLMMDLFKLGKFIECHLSREAKD
jgi:glycosyltransferase involved in cell wall biosynthesis